MDPLKTGFTDKEVPHPNMLGNYIFRHGSKFSKYSERASINTIDNRKYHNFAKVAESLKASITNDAKKEAQIASSAAVNSNGGDKTTDPFSLFYQRALGCFIRIEINLMTKCKVTESNARQRSCY